MKIRLTIIAVLLIAIVALTINLLVQERSRTQSVSSFEQCIAAGFPVMESAPRQCRDDTGTVFTEARSTPSTEVNLVEPSLTLAAAQATASATCGTTGEVRAFERYDPSLGVWLFALDAQRTGCVAQCVVDDRTNTAQVDWRCGQ